MRELILITWEELEEIIDICISKYLPRLNETVKHQDQKFLYSLRELADFMGCSAVTVQKL